jgi:hypothetical protein
LRLDLRGTTTTDKAGIASVAFDTIPDLPMEDIELYLPQGPHSVLSAATRLCTPGMTTAVKREIIQRGHPRPVHRTITVRRHVPVSLPMATEIVAHNGATVHQTTKVEVSGCVPSKARIARRSQTR